MFCGEPGAFLTRELAQSSQLILVGSDNHVLSCRCAATVNPAPLHPEVNFHGNDAQFTSEIRYPPLVVSQHVIAKELSREAQSTDHVADAACSEDISASWWHESSAVKRVGDLEVMQSSRV